MNNVNRIYTSMLTVSLLTANIAHIFSYKFFVFTILIVFYFNRNNFEILSNVQKILLKFIPISFYGYSIGSIFLANPRVSSIFWDMQNFLHFLNCDFKDSYVYKFINEERVCGETIGYGPLSRLISLNFDIWNFTLVFFFAFFFIIMVLIFRSTNYTMLFVIFAIAPSFNFLIFSLNADIFVFLFYLYIFSKNDYVLNYLDLFLLTILIQLKFYPVALLLGFFIFQLVNKSSSKKSKLILFAILLLNSASLAYDLFVNRSPLPEPISYTRTFGLYHDYLLIKEVVGLDEIIYIVPALFFISFAVLYKYPNLLQQLIYKNLTSLDLNNKFIVFFPTALLINLFQNFGYKFIFNFFIIYIFFKYDFKKYKEFLVVTCLLQTTYYLIGYGFINNYFNNFILIFSKLSFYLYFLIICYYFCVFVKKIFNNLYFHDESKT